SRAGLVHGRSWRAAKVLGCYLSLLGPIHPGRLIETDVATYLCCGLVRPETWPLNARNVAAQRAKRGRSTRETWPLDRWGVTSAAPVRCARDSAGLPTPISRGMDAVCAALSWCRPQGRRPT